MTKADSAVSLKPVFTVQELNMKAGWTLFGSFPALLINNFVSETYSSNTLLFLPKSDSLKEVKCRHRETMQSHVT